MSQRNTRDEELKRQWLEKNKPTICAPMPAYGTGFLIETLVALVARIPTRYGNNALLAETAHTKFKERIRRYKRRKKMPWHI